MSAWVSVIHTYVYIYGYLNICNPYTLVLTSFFFIVSVTADEQSVDLLLLLTLLNKYVGHTETIPDRVDSTVFADMSVTVISSTTGIQGKLTHAVD